MRIFVLFVSLMLLTGCVSSREMLSKVNPLNWGSGRAAKKEAAAEVRKGSLEDELVKSAQIEIVKTKTLLSVAQTQNPESLPVSQAGRTATNASDLLNQRQPLSVAEAAQAKELAEKLAAGQEQADREQKQIEAKFTKQATELAKVSEDLKGLRAKADREAAQNLELARELNNERLIKYGALGLNVALGLLAVAYRLNIGRLQEGAAQVLVRLRDKHGDEVADLARGTLDATLHTGEQKGVFKVYSQLTKR